MPTPPFVPELTPTADFPHPVGSTVIGEFGIPYTVTDRNGHAFVLGPDGIAGWYPQQQDGKQLSTFTRAPAQA